MKYQRPDVDKMGKRFDELIQKFVNASTFEEEDEIISEVNKLRNEFESMRIIAFINYSNNTNDEKVTAEQNYFDECTPLFSEHINKYYKALQESKFRDQLTKKYGSYLFTVADLAMKAFDPKIVEDLQKENHFISEYTRLKASAKIMFEGKERNLQELEPFLESPDREQRKNAFDAYWKFFSGNGEKFDQLFDKLVKLRNDMAVKMGFKNYIELGYAKMRRSDYDEQMVEQFRTNVKKYIVPLSLKLREKQEKRLGIDKIMAFDMDTQFISGNATPKGDPEWIVNNGKKMYDELSPETSEFYNFMLNNDLMDVFSRKGKAAMGYCDYIPEYKSPYIFANMNGTQHDVTVLTHEAGHAYQAYESRNFDVIEYYSPTYEACEIHSMSMEFFTYPWMNLFFKEDTEKFKFAHLTGCITFIPYGVLVDEFQHWVYENSSATPAERNAAWRRLEEIYKPGTDYGDNEFLSNGGRWQKQGHIYESPFYYIDYCLAQMCAFQFWNKAVQNGNGEYAKALKDYVHLCKQGGSKSFLELVKDAKLASPFDEKVMKDLVKKLEVYIDSVDDVKM